MIEFPQTAAVGKKIALAELKRKGLPARICIRVKSFVWAYKLSPATYHLAATDAVREVEVMDLSVREECQGARGLGEVLSAIDLVILSPMIFRVFDENGTFRELAMNLKTSGGALQGDSPVFRLVRYDQDLQQPSGVTTLESFLVHIAASMAGMNVRPGERLTDFRVRHYRLAALYDECLKLEKQLKKVTNIGERFELHKRFQQVEREVAVCR